MSLIYFNFSPATRARGCWCGFSVLGWIIAKLFSSSYWFTSCFWEHRAHFIVVKVRADRYVEIRKNSSKFRTELYRTFYRELWENTFFSGKKFIWSLRVIIVATSIDLFCARYIVQLYFLPYTQIVANLSRLTWRHYNARSYLSEPTRPRASSTGGGWCVSCIVVCNINHGITPCPRSMGSVDEWGSVTTGFAAGSCNQTWRVLRSVYSMR
jgi:hypothetical protein